LGGWLSYCDGYQVEAAAADLAALDKLVMRMDFGGKYEFWRYEDIDPAVSVLSALDRMGKELPGARDFYERTSEIAHPNSQGVHQF